MKAVCEILLLAVLLTGPSAHIASGQSPRTAQEFDCRGLDKQNRGDIDGAIEDFTKAIERSDGSEQREFQGAIADYDTAPELKPEEGTYLRPRQRPRVKKSSRWRAG